MTCSAAPAKNTPAQEDIDRMYNSDQLLGFIADIDYLDSVLPEKPHARWFN